jgi:hypothetical protein
MPIVKRQAPLLPEWEYAGQARKVSLEHSKSGGAPFFRIPLHLKDGRTITTFIRFLDQSMWVFEQLCKSGNMLPPDGEQFQITTDDLENRVFYFGVVHTTLPDGRTVANVKFHTKNYAVQQNPELAGVTFPNAAPQITLRPAPATPSPEPPPEAPDETKAKVSPPPAAPPTSTTATAPSGEGEELAGISPEEFAQALAYAKSLRAKALKPEIPDPKAER